MQQLSYRTKKGRLKAVSPTGKPVGFPAEKNMNYVSEEISEAIAGVIEDFNGRRNMICIVYREENIRKNAKHKDMLHPFKCV